MTILDGLQARSCPVCGRSEREAEPFLAASLDPAKVGEGSFASRKLPEYMTFRLVRCTGCATVYAAEAPPPSSLADAYEAAGYDSSEEADFAARTYARALAPELTGADRAGAALEIGTGTGTFLRELLRLGFHQPVGIEPSTAAIAAAAPDVRDLIRPGIFRAADHAPDSLALVACFQTLEHVPDPLALTRDAFGLLRPGGMLAFVTHDYTAPLNRLLGRRSPIIDIEHMQLFCPASIQALLGRGGFADIRVSRIRNTYPLRYWLRLAPLPAGVKSAVARMADAVGIGRVPVSVSVGNLLTVARKPAG